MSATAAGVRSLGMLWMFVRADIKARYAGSSVGFFWSVIHPLVMLGIYTVVFSVFLKLEFNAFGTTADFASNLFCGMMPWLALTSSVTRSAVCLQENAGLVTKVRFPVVILPLHLALSEMISSVIGLALLVVVTTLVWSPPSWHLLLLPLVLVGQFVFVLGLCFLTSTLQVFFRDTRHFLDSFLLVWLFLTPVFYPPSVYPEQYAVLLHANPMAHLVGIYREIVLNHRWPQAEGALLFSAMAVATFLVGLTVFQRTRSRFADYL